MRFCGWVVALLLLASSAVPASAMTWSVGANLGFGMVQPADKYGLDNVTIFGWPSAPNNLLGVVPLPGAGLRFGFAGSQPTHEFYIDTGLSYASLKDALTQRGVQISGNYQYNFGSGGSMSPYLTAGAGFLMGGIKIEDPDPDLAADVSATSAMFGGGLGIRHKMGNGNGTFRAEVRFDRATEGKDGDVIVIPEGNVFGLKFGFDLWDTQ